MKNILLVCTGNTCRSPMAKAILEDMVCGSGNLRGNVKADSAGTFAFEGSPAAVNAVSAMEEAGLFIQKHRAKQVNRSLVDWADVVLTMDSFSFEQMEAMFPEAKEKLHTLKGFAEGKHGYEGLEGYDVKDPFGKDLQGYRLCARELRAAAEKIIAELEREER